MTTDVILVYHRITLMGCIATYLKKCYGRHDDSTRQYVIHICEIFITSCYATLY